MDALTTTPLHVILCKRIWFPYFLFWKRKFLSFW